MTEGEGRPAYNLYDDSFYPPKTLEEIIAGQGKSPLKTFPNYVPKNRIDFDDISPELKVVSQYPAVGVKRVSRKKHGLQQMDQSDFQSQGQK